MFEPVKQTERVRVDENGKSVKFYQRQNSRNEQLECTFEIEPEEATGKDIECGLCIPLEEACQTNEHRTAPDNHPRQPEDEMDSLITSHSSMNSETQARSEARTFLKYVVCILLGILLLVGFLIGAIVAIVHRPCVVSPILLFSSFGNLCFEKFCFIILTVKGQCGRNCK